MSEKIIERCFIDIKPGEGHRYIEMFSEFRILLMSTPGAIATRLLRNKARADSFLCCMEFESQASKDEFVANPRLKAWAAQFWPLVSHETIEYFDEVG